jgi:hypothetical protein
VRALVVVVVSVPFVEESGGVGVGMGIGDQSSDPGDGRACPGQPAVVGVQAHDLDFHGASLRLLFR